LFFLSSIFSKNQVNQSKVPVISSFGKSFTLPASNTSYISSSGTMLVCVSQHYQEISLPSAQRVLDTRIPIGVSTAGMLPAGSTTTVSVSSVVPGAVAVVGTITLVNASPGYATLWATGTTKPLASNINVTYQNETIADFAVVPISSSGQFNLYVSNTTNAVFDVSAGIYPVNGAMNIQSSTISSCPSGSNPVTIESASGYSYTTPGTYTYQPAPNVNYVKVVALGGGGAGSSLSSLLVAGGGGGGGGALAVGIIPVSGCSSLTVVVGAGGNGFNSSGNGNPGSASSVTCATSSSQTLSEISAGGGSGGQIQAGGAGGTATFTGTVIVDVNQAGQAGGNPTSLSGLSADGGNGGASGLYPNGGQGGTPTSVAQNGLYGTGGGGIGLNNNGIPTSSPGNGGNGLVIITPISSLA
jgi:hypothetical protein